MTPEELAQEPTPLTDGVAMYATGSVLLRETPSAKYDVEMVPAELARSLEQRLRAAVRLLEPFARECGCGICDLCAFLALMEKPQHHPDCRVIKYDAKAGCDCDARLALMETDNVPKG